MNYLKFIQIGIKFGLGYIILNMILYFVEPRYVLNIWLLPVYFGVMACSMYFSIKQHKKELGSISFNQAFKVGFISLIALVLINSIYGWALFVIIDPSLTELSKEVQIEAIYNLYGNYLSENQLDEAVESIENQSSSMGIKDILISIIFGLGVGIILDLILSALSKTKDQQLSY